MGSSQTYRDRTHAGRVLAEKLSEYEGRDDLVVLGLPRGGVPVAAEVACRLHAPMDVFLVRKLGVPGHEELAMGAIAAGGTRVLNEDVVRRLGLPKPVVDAVADREQEELTWQESRYRHGRAPTEVRDRTVILVDDGLATGSTMRAAIDALRLQNPAKIVVGVPVGGRDVCESFRGYADDVVCAEDPEWFQAVSLWYQDFSQTSDDEVSDLLQRAEQCGNGHVTRAEGQAEAVGLHAGVQEVTLDIGEVTLQGTLALPETATGIVVFAHGSGSSRQSPRNRFVAQTMYEAGLATLLFDLLTAEEEKEEWFTAHLRFNIDLLAERLVDVTDWLGRQETTRELRVGYFGASTGAAAALVGAARRPDAVKAVVSRGGRPDLAGTCLPEVQAPTLLLVGGNDLAVIELNREAFAKLQGSKEIVIIPGASHLFEERGALEEVARLARAWFQRHLGGSSSRMEGEK